VSVPDDDPAVRLPDLEVAAELAREGASPFGRRLTARALLQRFGGEDGATRRRATAALELAGVVAVPSLADAELDRVVTLRRAPPRRAAIPLDRRVRFGAAGLLAIVLLVVVAVLLRNVAGGTGAKVSALPASAPAAAPTAPVTAAAPARTHTAPAAAGTSTIRLRIAPTAPVHVCVADGAGHRIFDGTLTTPLVVRRPSLRVRLGAATARVTANGRPLRVPSAPSGFAVTAGGVTPLAPSARVCT
jgi:hypothetical protein